MRHNILGGLVIFVVVVTCLLLLDDISNTEKDQTQAQIEESIETSENETPTDLAIIETED